MYELFFYFLDQTLRAGYVPYLVDHLRHLHVGCRSYLHHHRPFGVLVLGNDDRAEHPVFTPDRYHDPQVFKVDTHRISNHPCSSHSISSCLYTGTGSGYMMPLFLWDMASFVSLSAIRRLIVLPEYTLHTWE